MIDYGSISMPGKRPVNEDSIGGIKLKKGGLCFCLADGLGGHGNGEKASKEAVHTFLKTMQIRTLAEFGMGFTEAQRVVLELQKKTGLNMKTTMTAVMIIDDIASYGHIGDSRIYHFRNGELIYRTKDHSVPQMLVSMGEITEEEIRFHPDRNRLLNVIGEEWDRPRYTVDASEVQLCDGDRFLMCSDGFWEYVTEDVMCETMKNNVKCDRWIKAMYKEYMQASKDNDTDNFSAIALSYLKSNR